MRTRWSAYVGVSVALAGGVVVKALAQRPNFYSATVYLSQSSANLMILTNMVFVAACTILLGLQKLLYGPLRPIEIEQLYEKAWFAVTETCLAMTIFRGEIGAWFLVMFFALLAGKVWAWIGEGRVEVLEQQPPRNPRLFHTRLALSLGLSVFFDLSMLEYVVKEVTHMARPDMMVMFGFEFAVLSIVSLSTAARYAINLVEIGIIRKQKALRVEEIRKERVAVATRQAEETMRQEGSDLSAILNSQDAVAERTVLTSNVEQGLENATSAINAIRDARNQPVDEAELEVEGWEGKGRWIFYLDLATDFFKLVVYLSFFFILLVFYGLPIHILRDVFMTCRSFFKRIADFMRYRTATRDMNDRYPDATEQEIGREDVCIICREEMRPYQPTAEGAQSNPVAERMRPKKLPCGHILHFSCLRSWLERQQICPTCRTSVVPTAPTRGGQANAAGAQGAAGQPAANVAGQNGARARVYQLGPLRIGIGAARGNNLLENLQQQLGDRPPVAAPQANANGGQQFGFGIRWDGMRRRDREHRSRRPVQDQLDSVERQIQRELNALGGSLAELQVLRNMEAELSRLRALRQNLPQTQSRSPPDAQPATGSILQADASVTPLVGDQQNIVQAGSERLPAGLTLPEGWSMMPLHPNQGVGQQLPAQALPTMTNIPASAMFTMPGWGPQDGLVPHAPQNGADSTRTPTPGQPHSASVQVNGIPINLNQNPPNAGSPPPSTGLESIQAIARNMADIVAERTRSIHDQFPSGDQPTLETSRQTRQPTPTPSPNLTSTNELVSLTPDSTRPARVEEQGDSTSNSAPSIPLWGSANTSTAFGMTPSTPTPREYSPIDGTSTRTASGQVRETEDDSGNNESSSSSKKHTAMVEDLVEDPD